MPAGTIQEVSMAVYRDVVVDVVIYHVRCMIKYQL